MVCLKARKREMEVVCVGVCVCPSRGIPFRVLVRTKQGLRPRPVIGYVCAQHTPVFLGDVLKGNEKEAN